MTDTIHIHGRDWHLVPPPVPEYVYSTWMQTYRKIWYVKLGTDVWDDGQRAVIRDLMPQVKALVVPEAPNTIQAWICGRPGVCHYAFVAFPFRKMGFARTLLRHVCGAPKAGEPIYLTHHKGRDLAKAFNDCQYNPFPLYDDLRNARRKP